MLKYAQLQDQVNAPATRISQHNASSRPPPSATPSMAAMVGIGKAAHEVKVVRSPVTKSATYRAGNIGTT